MIKSLQEFQDDFIKVKGDAISSLARIPSSESFSNVPTPSAHSTNIPSSAQNSTTKKIEDSLQTLFVKQLEIRANELDHEEFDANHLRKQNRYKYEINKLDKQLNQTKNEGKRKHIRSKAQKVQNELGRIQSLLAKNQAAKQILARDTHAIDRKIFKIQEASSYLKGYFSQFIKSEIRMHQMEMNGMFYIVLTIHFYNTSGLGLELKNALSLKSSRQKDFQISRMTEILNQYQKISTVQDKLILDTNIKIPEELLKVAQDLQKCIKQYNEESNEVLLECPIEHDDRALMKDNSKISISLGRIASGISRLLSKPIKEPPSIANANDDEHVKQPPTMSKDSSQVSLNVSMVPSEIPLNSFD